MKNNPDDRSDNAKKIKQNIDGTIRNMEAAEEAIAGSSDSEMKKALEEKNERRKQARTACARRSVTKRSTGRERAEIGRI